MADYIATVPSAWSREDTFDYLADFRNVAEWDPSMERAELISGEPGKVGSTYRLTMSVLGVSTNLDYETVEVQRPERLVMVSESDAMTSTDTIRVDADSSVTYFAHLDLHGLRKAADPLAEVLLERVSDRAAKSLAAKLGGS
ncbi:MAG: SRPBCC family protein [Frankiaceae bacterium]|nr:SRPBCC family protein [Frankiaceae bacterium]MBV9871151.1 SRPBCC family protein [Frankiaceae bacterium]